MKRKHKHLRIRASVEHPFYFKEGLDSWMRQLIAAIDMKIMAGPLFCYAEEEINQGWTGVAIIEFSHVSIHIWELEGLVEVDVFSCKDFDTPTVMQYIKHFFPIKVMYEEDDRETDFRNEWKYG